jgi:uncharacterized coiled-coil protein SlyX
MNRITDLERHVAQLQWRLKGLEKERRAEEWRLRMKIAELNGMISGLRSILAEHAARLDDLEGS